jgi:hypothetical protein
MKVWQNFNCEDSAEFKSQFAAMDAPPAPPAPVSLLAQNLARAYACRRGQFPIHFPTLSHGVKIRGVRDAKGNHMVKIITDKGWDNVSHPSLGRQGMG